MEVRNISNDRPIGLLKQREDRIYFLVTPNHSLLGRSTNILLDDTDDTELAMDLPIKVRYRLEHHVTSMSWKSWANEVSSASFYLVQTRKKSLCGRSSDDFGSYESESEI